MSLYTLVLPLLTAFALTVANRFWGGSVTYYPKGVNPDGLYEAEIRFKQTFDNCEFLDWAECYDNNCGTRVTLDEGVIYNTDGRNAVNFNWCQTERVMLHQAPHNGPFFFIDYDCCWTNFTNNNMYWDLILYINLGNRSDTNKANRPPVSTSISFLRVPQNCPRLLKLIMFDPDKDYVMCDNLNRGLPAGFTLTQTTIKDKDFCTVSYSNTTGVYGVELFVYDVPLQNINLTFTNGSISFTSSSGQHVISILPLQFAVKVDPAVASCDEGVYLPKFLPPTPETGDQMKAVIRKELQIIIKATASAAGIRGIIISGPLNTTVETSKSSSDEFVLKWTQGVKILGNIFQSASLLRVTKSKTVVGLRLNVQSKILLTEREIEDKLLKQFHEELIRNGLPNTTTLSLRRVDQVNP